jgi:hypothetical protein
LSFDFMTVPENNMSSGLMTVPENNMSSDPKTSRK